MYRQHLTMRLIRRSMPIMHPLRGEPWPWPRTSVSPRRPRLSNGWMLRSERNICLGGGRFSDFGRTAGWERRRLWDLAPYATCIYFVTKITSYWKYIEAVAAFDLRMGERISHL